MQNGTADTANDVAIIGAGLAGTALALALHRKRIPCRIYEARGPDARDITSGVVLTPNGLHVLAELGVLPRIADLCWKSDYRTIRNDKHEIVRKSHTANEAAYGYENHRLYRRLLLNEMKTMLREQHVPIAYNSRFEGIVAEDENGGVSFMINGKEEHASLVVGADGIYSSIRQHLKPDAVPEFTGTVGVMGHIRWDSVKWPFPEYERACTIQDKPGAMFWIAENKDGSEIMVGKQVPRPNMCRAEWEAEAADKDKLCDFFRKDYELWNETSRSIIDALCDARDTLFLWPFLRVPKLPQWFSDAGGIILVGDAAHAIPPSSGQGVNQALEDVHALSILLDMHEKAGSGGVQDRRKAFAAWQKMRQERIDRVLDWAINSTNVDRMSAAEREKVMRERKTPPRTAPDDMSWLYNPVPEKNIVSHILSNASQS